MKKDLCVFVAAVIVSMGVGKFIAEYRIKHCQGAFDTTKCHRELISGKN